MRSDTRGSETATVVFAVLPVVVVVVVMDLLCCETTENECRAYPDPALLEDDLILQNLLRAEERNAPSSSYFECVQRDISPRMREVVAEWMYEVRHRPAFLPSTCLVSRVA